MGKAGKTRQEMFRHGETEGRKKKNEGRMRTKERRMEKVREMRKSTMHLHQQGFQKDSQVQWNQSRILLLLVGTNRSTVQQTPRKSIQRRTATQLWHQCSQDHPHTTSRSHQPAD